MSDHRTPKGFEDRWRFLTEPRRYADGRIVLTGQLRAHLSQFARQAPQGVIKKASGSVSYSSLHDHLRYVSRKGELELEGRDGERLKGMEAVREAASDWALDDQKLPVAAEISKNYVVSYLDDKDREAVHAAGRAFARQTFGPNHDYLLVPHTDTPHPHLHIAVRSFGDDGRRLNVEPKLWERWRHDWVERLQEQGLEAVATPRWSRGLVQRNGKSMAFTMVKERYEKEGAEPPEVIVESWRTAFRQVRGYEDEPQPWMQAIEKRHNAVIRTYRDAARELWRTQRPEDVRLSEAVDALVARFPEPITQRTQRYRQAAEIDRHERLFDWTRDSDRDRERDDGLDRGLGR